MKIDWMIIKLTILGVASVVCGWSSDLFRDDMEMYVTMRVGSMLFLYLMLFFVFNSTNENRKKEIQDLHLGIEEVMAINDELRREIDAQKVEKQENP